MNYGKFSAYLRSAGVLLMTLTLIQVGACNRNKDLPAPVQDNKWSQYLVSHSNGELSRKAEMAIRFSVDVAGEAQVGGSAAEAVEIKPGLDADITFANMREIAIKSKGDMPGGNTYRIALKADKLAGVDQTLLPYEFDISVIKQDFEINIDGLASDGAPEANQMVLTGQLTTADVSDSGAVEKMLSAQFSGKQLPLQWQHNDDNRSHQFTIKGIVRSEQESELLLKWDGKAIEVDNAGERKVPVPSINNFTISRVQAAKDNKQYILVYFSETLAPKQNMAGMIRMEPGNFTSRIDKNMLRIYPERPLSGRVQVTLESGISSESGKKLIDTSSHTLFFTKENPGVRFTGKGVILPDNKILSVPFEAVNVNSVQVTAFRIFENNMGQFLQTNGIDGTRELNRVGRYLWRKTIAIGNDGKGIEADKWNRYNLDVTDLLKEARGSLYRLSLSIDRGNASVNCSESDSELPVKALPQPISSDDENRSEYSSWEYAEDYYNVYSSNRWQDRNNPCKDDYYLHSDQTKAAQNFIASDIGIIAKQDDHGQVKLATTALSSGKSLGGVELQFYNFQNQLMGEAESNGDGFATFKPEGVPFYVAARKGDDKNYLKLSRGNALPVSHFDVGGVKLEKGVKGHIYGERGVWRPGDDIYLTFVLQDSAKVIPANHPVTMQLFNPQGQLVQTLTNNQPVDDFYAFNFKTEEEAPTGNWTAKAQLGGTTFSKLLKIETVVPNRLRVELDFGGDEDKALNRSEMPVKGHLFAQWLHGAKANRLKADVEVKMQTDTTRFNSFTDYSFDDLSRTFRGDQEKVFEGRLDENGHAYFNASILSGSDAPGMLRAQFTTRVFEEGGAFSSRSTSTTYHPFKHYVGIKLPKGDASRGMLLTDTDHTVEIASVDSSGKPVDLNRVQVSIFKIQWKWWWDQSGDSLAQYASSGYQQRIQSDVVKTRDGQGKWKFQIKYPDWGRYMVRACDQDGNHCSSQIVYIDWPGWAGRAQEQRGVGATMLSFFSDKQNYTVGETAVLQLPEATQGRALFSLESSSRILEQRWIELGENKESGIIKVKLTEAMAPNVYAHITLVQPHAGKTNDRPIRLYGVIPLAVQDPKTKLEPVLKAADEWLPESRVEFSVKEAQERAMTYTVAVVDEGLLGLTGFKTPNLHREFYRKEALGVTSWDLFDEVVGAYGAELERLLALGGSDDEKTDDAGREQRRFPPVVQFLGPFHLNAKQTRRHNLTLPQYIGQVRVMVVAGYDTAYGLADKSIYVRKSLAVSPTVPRVLGPGEDLTLPVTVFNMEDKQRDISLRVETDEYVELLDGGSTTMHFGKAGEQIAYLRVKVQNQLGKAHLRFVASSTDAEASQDVYVEVRSPNPQTVRQTSFTLNGGDSWQHSVEPHGLSGTNTATLEVSIMPPINLERRLNYLIQYPHGCLEQVTSSVFPQLYLNKLVALDEKRSHAIQSNVHAGIERLRRFQGSDGSLNYWPGDSNVNGWANNYAGHFLVEAQRLGYFVPAELLNGWLQAQTNQARAWTRGDRVSTSVQAYRLFTLALVGQPELGAMNRLREQGGMDNISRTWLAAAYHKAGLADVAGQLIDALDFRTDGYSAINPTFGSELRDNAVFLYALSLTGRTARAQSLVDTVSNSLAKDRWYSTQEVAYGLLAVAHYLGDSEAGKTKFTFKLNYGKRDEKVKSTSPIHQIVLPLGDEPLPIIVSNDDARPLFVTVNVAGTPAAGDEQSAEQGIALTVNYIMDGITLDALPADVPQGKDIVARLTITNRTGEPVQNIALTHMAASGFEINNSRLAESGKGRNAPAGFDYQDIRDDRILSYFSLKAGESKRMEVRFNAAYPGRCYLPAIVSEAMYDASKQARVKGQWLEIKR